MTHFENSSQSFNFNFNYHRPKFETTGTRITITGNVALSQQITDNQDNKERVLSQLH